MLLFLSLLTQAWAAEIAILEAQVYESGPNYDDVVFMAQGLRDALLISGEHSTLDEYEISDRLVAGKESSLDQARSLFASGRERLSYGDVSGAYDLFMQSVEVHRSLASTLGRRAELADVYFAAGEAALRLGRSDDAAKAFRYTEYLYPGYIGIRAPDASPTARSYIQQAQMSLSQRAGMLPDASKGQSYCSLLGVQYVVAATLAPGGRGVMRVFEGGAILRDISFSVGNPVPPPGAVSYDQLAEELLSVLGAGYVAPAPDPTADLGMGGDPSSVPSLALSPREQRKLDRQKARESGSSGSLDDERERSFSLGSRRDEGSLSLDDEEGSKRWWIWAGAGVVVGGGITTAVALSGEDDDPEETSGGYRIIVGGHL